MFLFLYNVCLVEILDLGILILFSYGKKDDDILGGEKLPNEFSRGPIKKWTLYHRLTDLVM